MLRTGILLPRSTLYPSLGLDLINALKKYLKQQNIFDEIKLVTDNIGFGIEEAEIYSKAEKMLLEEDVDITIVCADPKIIEMLEPLYTAAGKLLIGLNFGVNLPETWQSAPGTITHSLNFALHCSLTGRMAAGSPNKETINAVSYYDGGYNLCYCMMNENQQKGGTPVLNHVTQLRLSDFTLEPVAAFLEQDTTMVKNVLCVFSGGQVRKFYDDIEPLQAQYDLELFVSPMMLDETLKTGDALAMKNVQGYIPWHRSLKNNANELFKNAVPSANYFSLLGWETGMLLERCLQQQKNGDAEAAALVDALKAHVFETPRGTVKIDPITHLSYAPSYLATATGNMEITIESSFDEIGKAWEEFTSQPLLNGQGASWRNSYLCI